MTLGPIRNWRGYAASGGYSAALDQLFELSLQLAAIPISSQNQQFLEQFAALGSLIGSKPANFSKEPCRWSGDVVRPAGQTRQQGLKVFVCAGAVRGST